jgi:hypothetical protein
MARELSPKVTGSECHEVYDGGRLIARLAPHDAGAGWKIIEPSGNALTMSSYETPQLAPQYVPVGL